MCGSRTTRGWPRSATKAQVGFDDDVAGESTRISNRVRGLLTQIHPTLARIGRVVALTDMNIEPNPSGAPILNTALTGVTAVYLATNSFEVAALAATLAALFMLRAVPVRRVKHE
jgi:hypothetical protein